MPEELKARVRARLDELQQHQLLRTLCPPTGIDLSSNDYLGFANHPLLKARMMDAVEREGCGSTGSRLLRGERESFAAIERRFASFKGSERALYFSSGYLANLAVLATLPEAGDLILSDERNHASLIDGIRLSAAGRVVFPHRDIAAVARLVDEYQGGGQIFVVTESLFSMDGDYAPLAEYATICRATRAALIVDEAHAVGIFGERGSGLIESSGTDEEVFVSVNTAGKALGVAGAFVAGPGGAIDYLVQHARSFIFSTAPPPSVAAALDASLTLVATEPERRTALMDRARYLRGHLVEAGIPVPDGSSQIVPVVLGENDRALSVAGVLQSEGFDVRAIRPPTVAPGTARLRLSVNLNLTEATLDRFVACLAAVVGRSLPCSAVSS
ncbi:MAG: aminotransferase class I/II-fold pyridoxal phosphate-dependent enzyme [Candidatus Binataceae bacterium]